MSYLLDMEPVIYLSRQGGADPIAFFVYGGTQKGLRWAKHEKHGHLREEKQTTGNTMIRLKVREQGLSTARSTERNTIQSVAQWLKKQAGPEDIEEAKQNCHAQGASSSIRQAPQT